MKLDRNVPDGHGNKYGLIKNRRIEELRNNDGGAFDRSMNALLVLVDTGVLDWGCTPETEFFVMRLKDRCARSALQAYADAARNLLGDLEYSGEVEALAQRAGVNHPNCKDPD